MILSTNVLEELGKLVHGKPDLTGSRGSLFISKTVPAACITLAVPRDEFLKHAMALPNFSEFFRIIPVENQNFDFVLLGAVTVAGDHVVLDGEELELL